MEIEIRYLHKQLEILENIQPSTKYLIIPKGRRFGITQFGAHWLTECMIEGEALLWGDTISSNIDRYVNRYFEPLLKLNEIEYKWNAQKKLLELPEYGGYCDFRSADRPENWEGFGYNKIFLNEAGIILKNDYLYTNAVLPMLLDNPNSLLIAAGAPKGKTKKNGEPHRFYKLALSAEQKEKGYQLFRYTSYDNELLRKEDIEALEVEIKKMDEKMVRQEIYAEFIDGAGGQLWDSVIVERQRMKSRPPSSRTVVAIDPAISSNKNSDETGIVVASRDKNGNAYIIDDLSGKYTPSEWAKVATNAVKTYDADCIVAEKNQGGDMVKEVIRQHDKKTRVKLVTATKGKFLRAEPVYSLYEQGKVFHVGSQPLLEQQMISFNPNASDKSPDRVDAMVYGVTELLIDAPKEFFVV